MLVQKNILSHLIISIMNTIPNECTVLHLHYRFKTNNICYLILQQKFV